MRNKRGVSVTNEDKTNSNVTTISADTIDVNTTTEPPFEISSKHLVKNLHANQVTGDVNTVNNNLFTSDEQKKEIIKKAYDESNEYLSSSEYNSSNLNVSYLLLKYDNNLFKISILNLFSLINQSDNNFDSDNLANLIDSDEPYTLQITDGDNNNYNITVKDFLSSLYETPSLLKSY